MRGRILFVNNIDRANLIWESKKRTKIETTTTMTYNEDKVHEGVTQCMMSWEWECILVAKTKREKS